MKIVVCLIFYLWCGSRVAQSEPHHQNSSCHHCIGCCSVVQLPYFPCVNCTDCCAELQDHNASYCNDCCRELQNLNLSFHDCITCCTEPQNQNLSCDHCIDCCPELLPYFLCENCTDCCREYQDVNSSCYNCSECCTVLHSSYFPCEPCFGCCRDLLNQSTSCEQCNDCCTDLQTPFPCENCISCCRDLPTPFQCEHCMNCCQELQNLNLSCDHCNDCCQEIQPPYIPCEHCNGCCTNQRQNLSLWKITNDLTHVIDTTETFCLRININNTVSPYTCGFLHNQPPCEIHIYPCNICSSQQPDCPMEHNCSGGGVLSITYQYNNFTGCFAVCEYFPDISLRVSPPPCVNNDISNTLVITSTTSTKNGGDSSIIPSTTSNDEGNYNTDASSAPNKTSIVKVNDDGGKTGDKKPSGNSTAAILGGVLGSLIVLILAGILGLQVIRFSRKKKFHHHSFNGTAQMGTSPVLNAVYTNRPPLPPEPKTLVLDSPSLQLQQPSPYETAISAMTGVYSVLQQPDEKETIDESNRTIPNHYEEQHVYEETDRYVSTPGNGVVNAEYEVAAKTTVVPQTKTNSKAHPGNDDYADPDDAIFDDPKYDTQSQQPKRQGGEKNLKAKAPISTGFKPLLDDSDYTIPDDAIFNPGVTVTQHTRTKDIVESVLSPLYHELGKSEEGQKTPQDRKISSDGVKKSEVVTIEGTTYATATVKAPSSSTTKAASNSELDVSDYSQDPQSDTMNPLVKDRGSSDESESRNSGPLQKNEANSTSSLNPKETNTTTPQEDTSKA